MRAGGWSTRMGEDLLGRGGGPMRVLGGPMRMRKKGLERTLGCRLDEIGTGRGWAVDLTVLSCMK